MNAKLEELLEKIAKKHLLIETLKTRNSDGLDFHDCGVGNIKDALEAAFKAGYEVGANVVHEHFSRTIK